MICWFQNMFRVGMEDVPQIVFTPTYMPRDPNFKDNWRGKCRMDNLKDCQHIKVTPRHVYIINHSQ